MITNWPALRNGCLILASVALTSVSAIAQTQEPAVPTATASVISSVAITQGAQRSSVRVEGEGRLDARAALMANPDRLVLDFAGTRLAVQRTMIPGVAAPVRGVRLGQFRPDTVRVVIDLSETTPYQISRDGNAIVVFFESQPATPASFGATKISTENHTAPASFQYKAVAPRAASSHVKNLQVSAPRFALPSELTQPSVALASYGEKREPARPDGTAAQQAAQQANTAASTVGGTATQAATSAKYTGDPISVNLKDVDLRDFFRLIHEISGLNVVLDPAVKGSLTIVLDEVPWDQALDIVLQNNALDKQLNGNVLRIATRATLKTEAETQRDLEKAQAEAVTPVTVPRVLSYAKAATLAPTLKKFLSSRGDILFDDRSNQLIIRDIPSVIPIIDNLIRNLDRKSQQVEIEARVVSASRSFARDIGTQLAFATSSGANIIGGNSAVGASPIFRTITPGVSTSPALTFGAPPVPQPVQPGQAPTAANVQMPLVTNLGASAPTSGLSYLFTSPNFAIDFMISAAEAKGVGKLLSKPKVITQNNERSTVKQGIKIPIQTTINNK